MTNSEKTIADTATESDSAKAEYREAWRRKIADDFAPFLDMARQMKDRFPDTPEIELATSLAVGAGFQPPHWTGWAKCKNCGPLPSYAGMHGDNVLACPWCHTKIGAALLERLKPDAEKTLRDLAAEII